MMNELLLNELLLVQFHVSDDVITLHVTGEDIL